MRLAGFLFVLIFSSVARAEPLSFDAFLAGGASCKPSRDFEAFHEDIVQKYRNDAGSRGARVDHAVKARIPAGLRGGFGKARIPAGLRGGFGKARSVNLGGYTQVNVPVSGAWRGLRLAGIEFALGNETGVQSWKFIFSEPRSAVARVFGKEVEAADRALKRDPEARDFGHSAKIPSGARGEIACDMST